MNNGHFPQLKPYIFEDGNPNKRLHPRKRHSPSKPKEDGLTELAEWAKTHGWGAVDLFEKALRS